MSRHKSALKQQIDRHSRLRRKHIQQRSDRELAADIRPLPDPPKKERAHA